MEEINLGMGTVIDIERWQEMQNHISRVTGMAIITVDYKGIPITKHSYCTEFCNLMRSNPETESYCQKCDSRGGFEAVRNNQSYIYICHADIVDVAIPLILEDRYIGAVMAGQVVLPRGEHRDVLEKIATDKLHEQRLAAEPNLGLQYEKLPVMTLDQIHAVVKMLEQVYSYVIQEAAANHALMEMNRRLIRGQLSASGTSAVTMKNLEEIKRKSGIKKDRKKQRDLAEDAFAHPVIPMALRYIDDHIGSTITLKETAKWCHVSTSHFSRLFTKTTGENFSAFVNHRKIDLAKDQLRTTDDSVSVISDELGFSDTGYFIKLFKKREGVTPAVYRKCLK